MLSSERLDSDPDPQEKTDMFLRLIKDLFDNLDLEDFNNLFSSRIGENFFTEDLEYFWDALYQFLSNINLSDYSIVSIDKFLQKLVSFLINSLITQQEQVRKSIFKLTIKICTFCIDKFDLPLNSEFFNLYDNLISSPSKTFKPVPSFWPSGILKLSTSKFSNNLKFFIVIFLTNIF